MRIAGVTIPPAKRLLFALPAIYGIGRSRARAILAAANVDNMRRAKDLSPEEELAIRKIVEEYRVEGELKREAAGNVKRMKDIKSWRGLRHAKRLPVRGQRTRTNSRTVRGNVRKTMGSGRRKLEKT